MEEYPHRKGQVKILTHEKNEQIIPIRKDGLSASSGKDVHFINGADYVVRIPMAHGVDSLNVAAAAAVAFWQLRAKE